MKNLNKVLAITGIVAAFAITNVASIALANTGEEVNEGDAPQMQHRMELTDEQREEIKQHMEELKSVVESGDYDAWYALVSEHRPNADILEKINADNFYLLNEMHQKMQEGDPEGAKAIADELGLKRPMKKMRQMRQNFDPEKAEERRQRMEEVKATVESGDYDAWYTLVSEHRPNADILEKINADNFYRLGEIHEALQNSDHETAKAIADELGLERPMKGKFKGRMEAREDSLQQ
jgi:anti-sigma28 factor (negative regulator of flagellin synthesis)